MEALGGAEHPEEPDDAEVETSSFSVAMLGMVEVESFGHGPEDSDVGFSTPQSSSNLVICWFTARGYVTCEA